MRILLPVFLGWSVVHYARLHLKPTANGDIKQDVSGFGPVHLTIRLPGTFEQVPEPLLVSGRQGNSCLLYIRLLKGQKARLGIEYWGVGYFEGKEFPLPAPDATLTLVCYLPAFFPAEEDGVWNLLRPDLRKIRKTQYAVLVDGVVRLKGEVHYAQEDRPSLYVGFNPLGGSWVTSRFTGAILRSGQGN